jgi:hypothetical protein
MAHGEGILKLLTRSVDSRDATVTANRRKSSRFIDVVLVRDH